MGYGIPAAISAKLEHPSTEVVCLLVMAVLKCLFKNLAQPCNITLTSLLLSQIMEFMVQYECIRADLS